MLSREDDVDARALRARGWSIAAIARHLERDRKTIRAYLNGERTPGVRVRGAPDPFEPFVTYCTERLREDPHLWATALFDEVTELGYTSSYPSFTLALRRRALRPACEPCRPAHGRPVAIIEHPPGAETQWDWLELPDPPGHWDGYRGKAFLLVGALAHSGKWRGVLAEAMDAAHLVDGLHRVAERLGGLTHGWRFDRMSTVVMPGTDRINASFAAVAKHYAVTVHPCPARRGNRKGVVEKANDSAAQRWWRSLPDDITALEAQARLDTFCARKTDARVRVVDEHGTKRTVGELAETEGLRALPSSPFPATISVERTVRPNALVAFRGNRYSVPPELVGTTVTVGHRLGSVTIEIATAAGIVIAAHHRAPDGAGVTIRTDTHVSALNAAALAAFTTAKPHRRKVRIPPGEAARAAAAQLASTTGTTGTTGTAPEPITGTSAPVIDLSTYQAAAERRRSLP